MSVELYFFQPLGTNSGRVYLALLEKGVGFTRRELNGREFDHLQPEYLAINPKGQVPTLVRDGRPFPEGMIANEYIDVLPIHQMVKRETGWHERTVELDGDGNLVFGFAPDPTPRFDVLLPPLVRAAPVGAIYEWRPDAEIMQLATRIRDTRGAALLIDYGHVRSDAGDTLQAIARHSFADPLKNPGQADVTAHVDFQALARAADNVGARVHGPVTQGEFLQRLGIEARANSLMAKASEQVAQGIEVAKNRLIGGGRGGMGSMFKVLAISDPSLTALVGFGDMPEDEGADPS